MHLLTREEILRHRRAPGQAAPAPTEEDRRRFAAEWRWAGRELERLEVQIRSAAAPMLEQVERGLRRARPLFEAIDRYGREELPKIAAEAQRQCVESASPSVEDDIFAVYHDWPLRPRGARLRAAQRLVKHFARPVHRTRWHAVRQVLHEEAERRERSWREELDERTLAALFVAIGGPVSPEGIGPLGWDSMESATRAALNELLTEDLLGPGWRRKPTPAGLAPQATAPDRPDECSVASETLEMIQAVYDRELDDRERGALDRAVSGEEPSDFAEVLEVKPGYARVILHRARQKIRPHL